MRFILPHVVVVLILLGPACGRESADIDLDGVTIVPATATPMATEVPAPPLQGFTFPILGGCLPSGDQLLPNAPRPYRDGFHEGMDLYESDNCTQIRAGTEVVAALSGTVVRADLDYDEMTAAELEALQANSTSPEALDRFRGRQVWIDHGGGVVTRYAHLGGIAPGIAVGVEVRAGEVIAFVGESGTPESVLNPGTDNHLHFEVRLGESFLGEGMGAIEVRDAYKRLFSP